MKKKSPFDEVQNLITSKEEVEILNTFFVNKILSYQADNILFSIDLNRYIGRIPKWATDKLFNLGIKKRRSKPWLNYPKKDKKVKEKILQMKVCRYYCVNAYHAKQIIELLRNYGEEPEKFFGLKRGE